MLKSITINQQKVLFNTEISVDPVRLSEDFQLEKFKLVKELKNTNRSLVQLVEYENQLYIFKIPREKNNKKWIRFTTLFRDGEAFKSLKNLDALKSAGIETNLPLIASESRKLGMVIDSYLVYHFFAGEHCTKEHFPAVVKILKNIHAKGFVHGDSWINNFIWNENGFYPIDFNLKRVIFFKKLHFAHEFVTLTYGAEGIEKFYDQSILGFWYKIAWCYRLYLNCFRDAKKKWRGMREKRKL